MYMQMYLCTCRCTYVHVDVPMYMQMYLYTCKMYICSCRCTYVHVRCTYVHMFMQLYLCTCKMQLCTCTYVHVDVPIPTFTNLDVRPFFSLVHKLYIRQCRCLLELGRILEAQKAFDKAMDAIDRSADNYQFLLKKLYVDFLLWSVAFLISFL